MRERAPCRLTSNAKSQKKTLPTRNPRKNRSVFKVFTVFTVFTADLFSLLRCFRQICFPFFFRIRHDFISITQHYTRETNIDMETHPLPRTHPYSLVRRSCHRTHKTRSRAPGPRPDSPHPAHVKFCVCLCVCVCVVGHTHTLPLSLSPSHIVRRAVTENALRSDQVLGCRVSGLGFRV